MLVSELIRGLPIELTSGADVDVRGVAFDSRRVEEGDLFAVFVGERFDARHFVPDAIEKGAAAVLSPTPSPEGHDGPWLVTSEPRAVVGELAARVYGHPDREMTTFGVTGTNGKSTIVALVAAILEASGRPCGTIGTLGYGFADRSVAASRTTPEAPDLFRMLREMRDRGAEALAMEVSSHALAQGRVAGLGLDVALFTNLTRDHLDFHTDFEDYFATKVRIFDQIRSGGRGIVCVDDPYGARLASERDELLTYGTEAEVRAVGARLDTEGIRARVATPRGELEIVSPLVGAYNLENVLAAVATGVALDVEDDAIVAGLAARGTVDGRMQRVGDGPVAVFVDYAHTDAALRAALTSLRGVAEGEMTVVFGCGGDRDVGKRPLMGRVAGELADFAIITSDNPRSEDPLAIISAVEEGVRASGNENYRIVPDRREAIRRAIERAADGTVVLVAGKGHEDYQILGEETVHFSDREEIERALGGRSDARDHV